MAILLPMLVLSAKKRSRWKSIMIVWTGHQRWLEDWLRPTREQEPLGVRTALLAPASG